jgi:hypothetical protein
MVGKDNYTLLIIRYKLGKICILVPKLYREGQLHPSNFRSVNLVYNLSILNQTHHCAKLNMKLIQTPFYR